MYINTETIFGFVYGLHVDLFCFIEVYLRNGLLAQLNPTLN